jgi:predicted N-acyltransferase
MAPAAPPTDALIPTTLNRAADMSAAEWNALVPGVDGVPDNPFLDHAFFAAVEDSGSASVATGWQPIHLVLRAETGGPARAIMPLYAKSHSQGEYVFDHGWADAFERAGGAYYPKLQSAVPFTPVTGNRLLARTEADQRALLRAAEALADSNAISSVHATFIAEDEARLAVDTGWLLRLDTQYHWSNAGYGTFEDYLLSLSSRHRKVMKRERRDALADGLSVRWLTGADLTEAVWDQFFVFYQDTGSRKWGQPYLNRRFFSLLGESLGHRVVLMFAYDGDVPIAGTLSLVGRERLYGRYWGATREVPFLHFELCYYQAIDYAIAHGLTVVEAGAQGEHKLARGYAPQTTRSVHHIGHPGLRQAVARYLDQERRQVAADQVVLAQYTPFKQTP